jgi:hypothetical protein
VEISHLKPPFTLLLAFLSRLESLSYVKYIFTQQACNYWPNGWVARPIVHALAVASHNAPIRILYREGSCIRELPANTKLMPFTWKNEESIVNGLEGIDILM